MAQINPATFLSEVRSELNKVRWPSRDETIKLTAIVIGVSIGFGVFVGSVDAILVKITEVLLTK